MHELTSTQTYKNPACGGGLGRRCLEGPVLTSEYTPARHDKHTLLVGFLNDLDWVVCYPDEVAWNGYSHQSL